VRAYVARALSRRGRSRSDEPEGTAEETRDASGASAETDPDPVTTDGVQQPKRQVDDDQVDNDTSRAREPEHLNKGQAAADSKPGAKADATGPKGADGEARAESTTDGSERGAAEAPESADGKDAGDSKAKAASSGDATTRAAEANGAKQTATATRKADEVDAQPATPADAAAGAGESASAPTDQRADGDEDRQPEAAAEDEQEPRTAEADADPRAEAAEAEADPRAEAADATEAEAGETAEAEAAEVVDAEVVGDVAPEAEQPAAVVEEEPSEAVLAELVAARAEADGYLDDLRRLQAEFDNFRKRTMREQTARIASASQALVSRLLSVLDNFELAVSHAEQSRDFDRMLKGVEMVFGELNDVLAGEGLVPIEASGKPFDPERHEAVVAVEEDGVEAGTVVDVIRKGYEFNGRVLRPAMVKVAR
jgi:molecular chaperone GrpE